MTFFSQNNVEATILPDGLNHYSITTGDDLFNLLGNTGGFWNRYGGPPANFTIGVKQEITLPSTQPYIYSKIKNVTVDFQGNDFAVANQTGSVVRIPPTYNAQVTVSNVNNTFYYNINSDRYAPSPSGSGYGGAYYTSDQGMLFSSDASAASSVTSTGAQITYNNVNYTVPGDLQYNQPIVSNYIPINFTGTNHIETGVLSGIIGQISNIKVSSGTTTFISKNNTGRTAPGAMFVPYQNERNGKKFLIDVAGGATLEINNANRPDGVITFNGEPNSVGITNNGTLKINSDAGPFLGTSTTGFDLTANSGSVSTFSTAGSTLDASKMRSNAWIKMNLMPESKTSIISKNGTPLNKNGAWTSPSNLSIASSAKLLTYAGGAVNGGLTNSSSSDIPVTFNGASVIQGYTRAKIPSVPTTADAYDNLETNDVNIFTGGQTISSNKLDKTADSGLLVYPTLIPDLMGSGKYNWDYGLDQLSNTDQFLSRTSGDPLEFRILDTRGANPSFKITAAYTPKQDHQPFSMWFKHSASESESTANQLNQSAQTVLIGSGMQSAGGIYTANYDKDSGLAIRANNRALSGTYDGVVDWTLVDGI